MKENMIDKNKNTQENKNKLQIDRRLYQIKLIGDKIKRKKKLKIGIISKIKERSKNHKVINEISNDIEKVKLEPESLVLLDYINKKINKT
jgi:hypothetical protein